MKQITFNYLFILSLALSLLGLGLIPTGNLVINGVLALPLGLLFIILMPNIESRLVK